MTEDELQAIELRAKAALATPSEYDALWTGAVLETDVPALVAEVRRLRGVLDNLIPKSVFEGDREYKMK